MGLVGGLGKKMFGRICTGRRFGKGWEGYLDRYVQVDVCVHIRFGIPACHDSTFDSPVHNCHAKRSYARKDTRKL